MSGSRSSIDSTGASSRVVGGCGRIRAISTPISARSSTRTESWSVAYTPNSAASSSSRSVKRAQLALQPGGELGDQQRGGDAVLVADARRRHAVAERLLVAEGQRLAGAGPHDPLEAGQRLGVGHAAAPRRSRAAATTRRSWWRRGRGRRAASGGRRAARRPRRRAAPASRPVASGHGDRAPVGVRVVGDRDVGAGLGREREQQVHRAGLLRVGEGHGREARDRARPARPRSTAEPKPAAANAARATSAPTPCSGVYAIDRSRGPSGSTTAAASRMYAVDDLVAEHRAGRTERDLGERADGPDRGLDLGVDRRHDLGTGAGGPPSRAPR